MKTPSPSQKRSVEDFESQKLPDENRATEGLNEMVRDFTSVVPRAKSEVRRRIEEVIKEAEQRGRNMAVDYLKKLMLCKHDKVNEMITFEVSTFRKLLKKACTTTESGGEV